MLPRDHVCVKWLETCTPHIGNSNTGLQTSLYTLINLHLFVFTVACKAQSYLPKGQITITLSYVIHGWVCTAPARNSPNPLLSNIFCCFHNSRFVPRPLYLHFVKVLLEIRKRCVMLVLKPKLIQKCFNKSPLKLSFLASSLLCNLTGVLSLYPTASLCATS